MTITARAAHEAANELQAMADAVRDDAPAWGAILLGCFGAQVPTLGACRRAFADTATAALWRRPVETACGLPLRVVDDLAETFHGVVTGASDGENKAVRQAQAIASSLAHRVLSPA